MARKVSGKPHSIRLLRLFNFIQLGSRRKLEKPLKELSLNQQLQVGISPRVFIRFDYLPSCQNLSL